MSEQDDDASARRNDRGAVAPAATRRRDGDARRRRGKGGVLRRITVQQRWWFGGCGTKSRSPPRHGRPLGRSPRRRASRSRALGTRALGRGWNAEARGTHRCHCGQRHGGWSRWQHRHYYSRHYARTARYSTRTRAMQQQLPTDFLTVCPYTIRVQPRFFFCLFFPLTFFPRGRALLIFW